jgi:hypothetical protein
MCGHGQAMAGQPTAMHVARIRSGYTGKDGRRREYESAYLRRTYRDGGTVRHETLANLSGLGEHAIGLIEAALKGAPLVPAGQAMTIIRSLPHGHVAAAHAMAARLGLPKLLGPAGPAAGPGPSPGHLPGGRAGLEAGHPGLVGRCDARGRPRRGRGEHRPGVRGDGLAGGPAGRDRGEAGPPAPGPGGEPGPDGAAGPVQLVAGGLMLPAGGARLLPGGKKAKVQIEYGLLTDPAGRPVAVRVLPGNAGDPAAFTQLTETVRTKFHLARMVMVGDRGMITSARSPPPGARRRPPPRPPPSTTRTAGPTTASAACSPTSAP